MTNIILHMQSMQGRKKTKTCINLKKKIELLETKTN